GKAGIEPAGKRDPTDRARESFPIISSSGHLVTMSSPDRLAHVAILVLLAAAAGTGIVAADAFAAIADRLKLLIAALAVGDGGVLLTANVSVAGGGRARRGFVDHRADRPHRLLERFLFFHAENGVGNLVLDALPHRLEFFHPFALVD